MADFGQVDFVLADIDPVTNTVGEFVSVELQSADITGSFFQVYDATIGNRMLDNKPKRGINWGNVRKRFISQLITKSIYHFRWNTRMIAVLQTPVYERLRKYTKFDELQSWENCSIAFMLYDYKSVQRDGETAYELTFDKFVRTSHNSLMMSSLYIETPPKADFCKRIQKRLL